MDFSGKIRYANNVPMSGVSVRMFDKDTPGNGNGDDNLTTSVGVSDSNGDFTVEYEPSKYLDYSTIQTTEFKNPPFDWTLVTRRRRVPDISDIYHPYLEFRYQHNNQARRQTVFFNPLTTQFTLPEVFVSDSSFTPDEHGFNFVNGFSGIPIPFSVPSLPGLPPITSSYGLCGGMAAAASDFFLAGRPIPTDTAAPAKETELYQYLYKRLMDTFGALGENIVKMAHWMNLPDGTGYGTQRATWNEFSIIRAQLNDEQPVVLGLVRKKVNDTYEIWRNHQVLAYSYEESSNGVVNIDIYDPNYPNDNGVIEATPIVVGNGFAQDFPPRLVPIWGYSCKQKREGVELTDKPLFGFFAMAYTPVVPPSGL